MRAMSKDRDIDDILESLNQLLREGESHNDDHVESVEDPKTVKQQLSDLEDELTEVESINALLSATPEVTDTDTDSKDEIEDDTSGTEPEAETAESWDQDEPDVGESGDNESEENDPEEDEISDDGDQRLSIHRVVLTEEMLVDNPQRNLLSLVGNSVDHIAEQVDEVVEPEEVSESQAEPSIDHALMAELLERISDDVIQQLPILIKSSLEQHLNDLGEQANDSTDQTEE